MAIKDEKANAEIVGNALKETARAKEPTQLIYIGPNLLALTTYAVVDGEFPLHIKALNEKCPSIEKLFVPVTKLTAIEPRTKTKGTIEYRYYQNVLDYMGKKGSEQA